MHPILIDTGLLGVRSYGVFMAAAVLLGMAWTMIEARRLELDPSLVPDLGLRLLAGLLLGSRLLYVAMHPLYFLANPLEIVQFWRGGLTLPGGAVLGALLGLAFMRKNARPFWTWLDAMAPGLALARAVASLGCLADGCCHGLPTDLFWGVVFLDPDSRAQPLGVPLHPTQFYVVLGQMLLFLGLVGLRGRVRTPGRTMGLCLVLGALLDLAVDHFRGDFRGAVGPFTVTQLLSLGLFGLGAGLLVRKDGAQTP